MERIAWEERNPSLDQIGIQDARGTYGLVGNDVAADEKAHAGAVLERGANRARRSAAAQDASPNRGQPTSHLSLSQSLSLICLRVNVVQLRWLGSIPALRLGLQLGYLGLNLNVMFDDPLFTGPCILVFHNRKRRIQSPINYKKS
jgi:hypothetical protein